MPNGFIDGFAAIKRDLVLAVDESLHPALTFGLEGDPPGAVARATALLQAWGPVRAVRTPSGRHRGHR